MATAPIAAAGLIAGYGVAVASGSRPLGGLVLAACGLVCIVTWLRRDGRRTAVVLTIAGLGAFLLSHVIGLVIGAWPALLLVAAATSILLAGVRLPPHESERPPRRRSRTLLIGRRFSGAQRRT